MGEAPRGIPGFDELGNLPPGIHPATLEEVERRFTWNPLRQELFAGLKKALQQMALAGVERVWLGGSFISASVAPRDIDGCWESGPRVNPVRLDPAICSGDGPAMRRRYGVHFVTDTPGPYMYVDFFQRDQDGNPRGILLIEIGGMI